MTEWVEMPEYLKRLVWSEAVTEALAKGKGPGWAAERYLARLCEMRLAAMTSRYGGEC